MTRVACVMGFAALLAGCSTDTFAGGDAGDGGDGGEAGSCTPGAAPTGTKCAVGECFCAAPTACFQGGSASSCCITPVVCSTAGGGDPDASSCAFDHPLVDGGARFCGPGACYCKWTTGESCYPSDLAAACCPSDSLVCY